MSTNLYIGVFDNYAVDEDGDDLLCRFTLIVHADSVEKAAELFEQYMDEHEHDEVNPIVGVVYESTIIEIQPGASVPKPLRFDQVTFEADDVIGGMTEVIHSADEDLAGTLIQAYTLHDEPDGEQRAFFWESEDEPGGEGDTEEEDEDEDEDEEQGEDEGGTNLN